MVITKEIGQTRNVTKEVESHFGLDIIDLNDKDKNDKIPLKEMLSRVKVSSAVPLSNPIPTSFAEPRLEFKDENLKN